jgi:hypothetical protein
MPSRTVQRQESAIKGVPTIQHRKGVPKLKRRKGVPKVKR